MFWYRNFAWEIEKLGTVAGWHRSWHHISKSRGGVPTCNLEKGGEVKGVFLRLPGENWELELNKVREREERATEQSLNDVPGVTGTVYFWTMTDNLQHYPDLKGKEGPELYQALAKRALSTTQRERDKRTAEEYAREVLRHVPDCPSTVEYVRALDIEKGRESAHGHPPNQPPQPPTPRQGAAHARCA